LSSWPRHTVEAINAGKNSSTDSALVFVRNSEIVKLLVIVFYLHLKELDTQ
jgi:hypothetical protein